MAGQDELYNLLWQVAAYTHLLGEETFAGTSLTVASGSMWTFAPSPSVPTWWRRPYRRTMP